MKKFLVLGSTALFAAISLTPVIASAHTYAPQDTAKQDTKDAGNDVKDAAKKTGSVTKKAGEKTADAAAEKTKEGADKVEDKTAPKQ